VKYIYYWKFCSLDSPVISFVLWIAFEEVLFLRAHGFRKGLTSRAYGYRFRHVMAETISHAGMQRLEGRWKFCEENGRESEKVAKGVYTHRASDDCFCILLA